MTLAFREPCIKQGSDAWLELRKTKVTATDASVVMGLNPWKDIVTLYEQKLDLRPPEVVNAAMQKGMDYEAEAREYFEAQTGTLLFPTVIVKDWQMASLDGIDLDEKVLLEIKCGGKKLHDLAKKRVVPKYYQCQMQHQMYLTNLHMCYYLSYRPEVVDILGNVKQQREGIYFPVERDDAFIEEMVTEEWKFYECLRNRMPPIPRST